MQREGQQIEDQIQERSPKKTEKRKPVAKESPQWIEGLEEKLPEEALREIGSLDTPEKEEPDKKEKEEPTEKKDPEEELKEIVESGKEMEIKDERENVDDNLVQSLENRLESEEILEAWRKTRDFFGEYGALNPSQLKVQFSEGNFGNGTIDNDTVILEMGSHSEVIDSLMKTIPGITQEQAENVVMGVLVSTTLHEGTHGLLDSKPGSKFFQEVSGEFPDQNEEVQSEASTLIDEGLTYALQGFFYDKEIDPVGSMVPNPDANRDNEVALVRKRLGQELRPMVKQYVLEGKKLDKALLMQVVEKVRPVIKDYMEERGLEKK